jgi:hypothetical protein
MYIYHEYKACIVIPGPLRPAQEAKQVPNFNVSSSEPKEQYKCDICDLAAALFLCR